jgi:hypothetical protein
VPIERLPKVKVGAGLVQPPFGTDRFNFKEPEQSMDNSTLTHGINDAQRLSASAGDQAAAGSHWRSADSARDTLDRARGLAHEAVDRLASGATGLVDRLEGRSRGWTDVPQRAWDYSRSSVQNHPISTVALAVLAGYAIARLLDLRRL